MIDLHNCSWEEFSKRIINRPLYCFGSGSLTEWLSFEISGVHIADKIIAFVDNNKHKVGTCVTLDGIQIPIISFDDFVHLRSKETIMLITSMYYAEMIQQMDANCLLNDLECYIEVFLEENILLPSEEDMSGEEEYIPRIIHYCWFGKKDLPDEYKCYIESWQKFCPDYKIMRWDESNYDYKKVAYIRQAYEAGKYAFVSDYARMDVVYEYGGVYLDTDVEVIKNLDSLLKNKMFCGFEQGNCINTGLGFGACKGFEHLRQMRDIYKNVSFVDENGNLNLTACTKYQTDYMKSIGLQRNGRLQMVDDIRVYPRTVLAPLEFYGIHNYYSQFTYSVHHYAATWLRENSKRGNILQQNDVLRGRMKG